MTWKATDACQSIRQQDETVETKTLTVHEKGEDEIFTVFMSPYENLALNYLQEIPHPNKAAVASDTHTTLPAYNPSSYDAR